MPCKKTAYWYEDDVVAEESASTSTKDVHEVPEARQKVLYCEYKTCCYSRLKTSLQMNILRNVGSGLRDEEVDEEEQAEEEDTIRIMKQCRITYNT